MEYSHTLTGGMGYTLDEIDSEAALIEAAQKNPAAFEPLYQRYKVRVYRYLFFRLRREEDAADLTQQVFLKVLSALPNYSIRKAPFAAWLFRIAYHTTSYEYLWARVDTSGIGTFYYDYDLFVNQGTWTLTITQGMNSWTFHFVLPPAS